MYLRIRPVAEVGQGPARVHEHIDVTVVEEASEAGQEGRQHLEGRWRVLVAYQVDNAPGYVAQHLRGQSVHVHADGDERRDATRLRKYKTELFENTLYNKKQFIKCIYGRCFQCLKFLDDIGYSIEDKMAFALSTLQRYQNNETKRIKHYCVKSSTRP